LWPIAPAASEQLRLTFRVPEERWTVRALLDGGRLEPGHEIGEPTPPFSRMPEGIVAALRSRGRTAAPTTPV
ncbi:MAG: hypothetical protein NZ902_06665, partial [Acidilobaceae archaeon]|nr:hypothetical protein [Acidilobaceae archaeon]